MSLWQILALSFVQGVTELLPISSSGHLILVSWLAGWPDQSLTFDAMAHGGSLLAVLWFMRREWIGLAKSLLKGGTLQLSQSFGEAESTWIDGRKLFAMIVVATLPLGVAGLLLRNVLESEWIRSPTGVAMFLIVTSLVLTVVHFWGVRRRELPDVNFRDALLIGIAQGVAVFPGISRSGTSIAAGAGVGLSRSTAVGFSFMIAAPAIGGVVLFLLVDMVRTGGVDWIGAGVAVGGAFVASLTTMRLMMMVVRRLGFIPFAVYAAGVGAAILALRAFGV